MEIAEHGTLHQFMLSHKTAERKLTEPEVAKIIKSVLKAVRYMHDKGIIHRDLKPSKSKS